jgi:hypothetical protein
MPWYKDSDNNLYFMSNRLWKHAVKLQPGLKETIPEPIKENDADVPFTNDTPKFTQVNSLEGISDSTELENAPIKKQEPEKPKRNVSRTNKSRRQAHRKVR